MRPVVVTLSLLILLAGCRKNNNPVDSSADRWTIHGQVSLVDEFGNQIPGAQEVTVALAGSRFITTTDSNGQWTLGNIPTNGYILLYSKALFGTWKEDLSVPWGRREFRVTLTQTPSFRVGQIAVRIDSSAGRANAMIIVTGSVRPASTQPRRVIVACGLNRGISIEHGNWWFVDTTGFVRTADSVFQCSFPANTCRAHGIPVGDTLYVRAYPSAFDLDVDQSFSGMILYTGAGEFPSTLDSVIVP